MNRSLFYKTVQLTLFFPCLSATGARKTSASESDRGHGGRIRAEDLRPPNRPQYHQTAVTGRRAFINSRLSRCITARGSSTVLSLEGPTKVKAHKSFLFTECSLKVD